MSFYADIKLFAIDRSDIVLSLAVALILLSEIGSNLIHSCVDLD